MFENDSTYVVYDAVFTLKIAFVCQLDGFCLLLLHKCIHDTFFPYTCNFLRVLGIKLVTYHTFTTFMSIYNIFTSLKPLKLTFKREKNDFHPVLTQISATTNKIV